MHKKDLGYCENCFDVLKHLFDISVVRCVGWMVDITLASSEMAYSKGLSKCQSYHFNLNGPFAAEQSRGAKIAILESK